MRLKNRHKGTLIGIPVIPAFRGRRVGQLVLGRLIEEVYALDGTEQLNPTVTHSNARARTLYPRAGFITIGLERNALKTNGHCYGKERMVLMRWGL